MANLDQVSRTHSAEMVPEWFPVWLLLMVALGTALGVTAWIARPR